MAKTEDQKKTSGIGDFCCKTSYVRFQIFHLRQHVERSKKKLDLLAYSPDSLIYHLVRHLTLVSRTLEAVENDLTPEKQFKDKTLKERSRNNAGQKSIHRQNI